MIAGIAGWTREKKSRKRLSNIGGEAESWAVRSCAIGADLSERPSEPGGLSVLAGVVTNR